MKDIDELRALPSTEIRVSHDTRSARLHAKAYIFRRETGFSTAYFESSTPQRSPLTSGLEWDVNVTAKEQEDTFEKIVGPSEIY